MQNISDSQWSSLISAFEHWAGTPENGYLGSTYGGFNRLKAWLSDPTPESHLQALQKVREDLKVLPGLPEPDIKPVGADRFRVTLRERSAEIRVVDPRPAHP